MDNKKKLYKSAFEPDSVCRGCGRMLGGSFSWGRAPVTPLGFRVALQKGFASASASICV